MVRKAATTRVAPVPAGFGLGFALTRSNDPRTWILSPDIKQNEAARTFGAGVALQIRVE
jgi:hypothetical protein